MRGLDWLLSLRNLAFLVWLFSGLALAATPGWALTSGEHLERARGYFDKREFDSSIIELKNALQQDQKNVDARLLLGRIYILKGRGADAEKELELAHQLGADATETDVLIAQAQLLQYNFQKVLDKLEIEETDLPVRRATRLTLRGEAQLGLGNTSEAKRTFKSAIALDVNNADAHASLGAIAVTEGALDVAEEELAIASAADPTALNVLKLRGDIKVAQGLFGDAEQAYKALVNAYPFIPHVLRLAFAQSALGNNKEAIRNIDLVLRANPHHPGANHLRALTAYRSRDYKTAKLYIDKALSYLPLNPQFQLLAAAINYALGNNEQALRYIERYVNREPNNEQARRLMAAILLRFDKPREAKEVLKPLESNLSDDDAQALTLIALAAVRSGDLERGRHYFEQLVAAQPDNAAARAELGAVKVALGDVSDGIPDLEKSLEQDPKLTGPLISLIVTYLNEHRYDRALEAARRAQQRIPDNPLAYVLGGIAQIGLGDLDGATQSFEQALAIRPGDPTATNNLAAVKIGQGKFEEAESLYNKVLQQNPDHLETLLRLARFERQRNHRTEEMVILERAFDRHPEAPQARLALARALIERRNPQRALEISASLLNDDGNNPAVLEVVGEAQLRIGNPELAISTFRHLVEVRPDIAGPHFSLAGALEAAGRLDDADVELQKVLLLEPGHTNAKFARARILVRKGKLDVAKSLVDDLKSAYPREPAIIELEARIALGQKHPEAAIRLLQHALEEHEDSDLAILLSQAQAQSGAIDAGLASLDNWLVRFPNDIRVRSLLAQSYLKLERFENAQAEYQKILANAADNIAALNNLAWLLWRDGRAEEALVHARRALELAPDNPGVLDTLGIILLGQGNSAEALPLLRRAYTQLPQSAEVQLHLAKALIDEGKTVEAKVLLAQIVSSEQVTKERDEAEALLRHLQ